MKTQKKQKTSITKLFLIASLLYFAGHLATSSRIITIENNEAQAQEEIALPDPCELKEVVCDYEADNQREKIEKYFQDHNYDRIAERMANYDKAKEILSQSWESEKVKTMLAIMAGESKFDQTAKGDVKYEFSHNGKTIGHSCGLAQIRVLPARADIGVDCEYLKNPENNVKYAMQIVDRYQRFTDWTVYNKGIYLQFK